MRKQRQTFAERQLSARRRAEAAKRRQCGDCGALCPSLRGNPGEYGKCTNCGGSPALMYATNL